MKNLYRKLNTYHLILAALISVLSFSCSNDAHQQDEQEAVKFELTALLERDKDLSYDEFVKINAKFDQLKVQYESDSTNFESLLKIVEIYIYEARVSGEHPYYYNAALNTLNELIVNKDNLTEDQYFNTLFYKSTVQLSQHNFSDALVTGNRALKINDKNSGIYGVLVDANVEIGNYDAAVAMCDKMVQTRPDLRSYSRTSYLREIYGDVEGSKEAMIMAINAGAPYSEYKCWSIVTLGHIYESIGELDSANVCFATALVEREKYPFAIAGQAGIEAKKGNYKDAENLYKAALDVLPEIGFNISLAKLLKSQGKTKEYKKKITEIEKMFNEDIKSGHNMSLEYGTFIMNFKKDFETAISYGQNELANRPNNIDVNKLLAFAYYGKNDISNAQKYLSKAMITTKRDADLVCLDGLINKDLNTIKRSFVMNPYQTHLFVQKAKNLL